jgi:tight adherence protein B
MTTAALSLALALLVAPYRSRRRLEGLALRAPIRGRVRLVAGGWVVAVVAVIAGLVAPIGAVVAATIVGATVLLRRSQSGARQRRGAESTALQSALDVLVGELRVGAHPVAAFDIAAAEIAGPVADSLRAVSARARLGADVGEGLRCVARESSVPAHWERLAVCWQLAETYGLAIGTLMHTAQRDIVERERFSTRAEAGMAGARTTAAVLAGLPVLGIGLGQLIGADPLTFLFSGGAGGWLLVIGVALACAGLLWTDRITRQLR